MRLPHEIHKALVKTARNAALLGVLVILGLLYLLVTSRFIPSVAPVVLWWPFEVVGWIAVLIAGVLTWDSIRAVMNPRLHDAVKRLTEFGISEEMVEGLALEVEGGEREKYGCMTFLPNFILIEQWASYAIIPIDWVVWAYVKETEHRKYFIHVRSTYSVFLALRNEELREYSSSAADAENQVLCISQRSDRGMVSGYDEGLSEAWSENPKSVIHDIQALASARQLGLGPSAVVGAAARLQGEDAILNRAQRASERAREVLDRAREEQGGG